MIKVDARVILDSRKEKTIEVSCKNDLGIFSASAPSGKSKGKFEKPAYINSVEQDIETIKNFSEKISELKMDKFADLLRLEDLIKGKIGANSLYALEISLLKAIAPEQGKELWQVINEKASLFPKPLGNCIGGGLHSKGKKPDFQEFLVMPRAGKFADNVFLMNKAWKIAGEILDSRNAKSGLNDENAWQTSLSNEEVMQIMDNLRFNLEEESEEKIGVGVDMASSTFYVKAGKFYHFENMAQLLQKDEQIAYLSRLIENFNIDYVEDPLQEDDFLGFNELNIRNKECLVCGDDLIVSQVERLKEAIKNKSVNCIIVKPNQSGSLIETVKLVNLARKNKIKTVFSHRSGETLDYALADLAFALQTDFIKTGIKGREREIKLNRMIQIERSFE